jgi:NAD(P)-dependent dehydrogenase (short-subunit alcohol dehydrogenase family)
MIFTKGLGKQLADKRIRVNAVAPQPVWTPLQVTGGQPPEKLPTFGQNTPLGRAGQAVRPASISGGKLFDGTGVRCCRRARWTLASSPLLFLTQADRSYSRSYMPL